MKRFMFLMLTVICICPLVATNSILEVLDEMSKHEAPFEEIPRSITENSFRTIDFDSLLDISHQCDTVFIDELYSDDGTCIILLWNIKATDSVFNYPRSERQPSYYHYPLRKDYVELVHNWDTTTLKILGPSRCIPQIGCYRSGTSYHILTRIIIDNGKYSWCDTEFWTPILDKRYREKLMKLYYDSINLINNPALDSIMKSVTYLQLERFPDASVLATKQDIDFSDALLLDSQNDTVYMVESVADTGLYNNISVWNKRSNVTVLNIGSESEIKTPIYFNTETKYIEQWDTTMLLKAGANINIQTNRYTVERKDIGHHWTTRVIITNGEISCETIKYYYPWFEEDMDRRFNRLSL